MDKVINPINPRVHRALYPYSIKRFLESKCGDLMPFIERYEIEHDDMMYSHLLDKMIINNDIEDASVDDFLIAELNYGRLRNVYVSFIRNVDHLVDENKIIEYINGLIKRGYSNSEKVTESPFIYNLRRGIKKGEKELIWFYIDKDENDKPVNIRFLLAKGVSDTTGEEFNNYIGIEINLEYKLLVIKLRNFEGTRGLNYSMDTLHKSVEDDVKKTFNLIIPSMTAKTQSLVYNMVNELSSKVLDRAINEVDTEIKYKVRKSLEEWTEKILSEDIVLPEMEFNVLEQNIMNNYYRIYMQNEYGVLAVGELKDKFEVNGYPRSVSFKDDTIGEARAKSPDPKESLLDTSIYYDVKARLDQAQTIRLATIYWIDSPGYDYLGTTFYTDVQERFKFVVLANFFDKEICDYVLQQIDGYSSK